MAYKIEGGSVSLDFGKLRHAVTIQSFGPTSPATFDASGPVRAWGTYTTAMAAIKTVRGTDVIRSGQVTTQLFLTVTMWWQSGILPNMRVLNDNGSKYVIQSIENILELNTILVLNCLGIGAND